MTASRRVIAGALSAMLLMGACASPTSEEPDVTVSRGGAGRPVIRIVAPEFGATVHGGTKRQVEITVRVSRFELVDKIGKKAKKGEGHIVFYRAESENARIPMTKGQKATVGGSGKFTSYATSKTSYKWPFMPGPVYPEGPWTFAVQLVNNDQTPLVPPQVARVSVEVLE
jgi:hypothetical protein